MRLRGQAGAESGTGQDQESGAGAEGTQQEPQSGQDETKGAESRYGSRIRNQEPGAESTQQEPQSGQDETQGAGGAESGTGQDQESGAGADGTQQEPQSGQGEAQGAGGSRVRYGAGSGIRSRSGRHTARASERSGQSG